MTQPQNTTDGTDRDTYFEKLYNLIRKRVKCSFTVRRLATVDDVTGDVFLLLVEQILPPLESEDFQKLLTKTINRLVRRIKRSVREMLDVDELGESEHPFYEMDFRVEDENFELVFEKFCESFPDPQRTIFKKFRFMSKQNIAALVGISRNTVAQIIKTMPGHFRNFLECSNPR